MEDCLVSITRRFVVFRPLSRRLARYLQHHTIQLSRYYCCYHFRDTNESLEHPFLKFHIRSTQIDRLRRAKLCEREGPRMMYIVYCSYYLHLRAAQNQPYTGSEWIFWCLYAPNISGAHVFWNSQDVSHSTPLLVVNDLKIREHHVRNTHTQKQNKTKTTKRK